MMGYEPTATHLRRLLKVDASEEVEPPPPSWKPHPGDTLRGTFIRWETVTGNLERQHKIAIVEDRAGVRHSIWCSPIVLRAEMKRARPQPGDAITIQRRADKDTGKPNPLKIFRVTVRSGSGSPARADWTLEGGKR